MVRLRLMESEIAWAGQEVVATGREDDGIEGPQALLYESGDIDSRRRLWCRVCACVVLVGPSGSGCGDAYVNVHVCVCFSVHACMCVRACVCICGVYLHVRWVHACVAACVQPMAVGGGDHLRPLPIMCSPLTRLPFSPLQSPHPLSFSGSTCPPRT